MNARPAAVALAAALISSTADPTAFPKAAVVAIPRAALTAALPLTLPGTVDSNSPLVWDLDDGQRRLFVMTSHSGQSNVSSGASIERFGATTEVTLLPHPGYGVWMEAVVSDDVETWYGYYHNEWPATACGRGDRFVPRIGAAMSTDRGRSWKDLGIVLQATQSTTACDSNNRYVIGGVGDLSVMLDPDKKYLYIFYSQYQRQREAQGVAVARLRWADRDRPAGRVASGEAASGSPMPAAVNRPRPCRVPCGGSSGPIRRRRRWCRRRRPGTTPTTRWMPTGVPPCTGIRRSSST